MARAQCHRCLRPPALCYCDTLVHIDNPLAVILIQHPDEAQHPFNTGRILTLCLSRIEHWVCERLSDDQINQLQTSNCALLYPDLAWLPDSNQSPEPLQHLVIIDATWRKSRKMLHLNPSLQALPRISLEATHPTTYRLRKSNQTEGLSTLESSVHALQSLNPATDYQPLLQPFNALIERQWAYQQAASAKLF